MLDIQCIEDYLMNNDASVTIQSYLGEDDIEYEAVIEKPDDNDVVQEVALAYSLLSFEDALNQLDTELAKEQTK